MAYSKQRLLISTGFVVVLTMMAACGVRETSEGAGTAPKPAVISSTEPSDNTAVAKTATVRAVQIAESTKIALIEADQARLETLWALPPVTKDLSPPPPMPTRVRPTPTPYDPLSTPHPDQGKLMEDGGSSFPSSTFLPENKWVLRSNGLSFEVFAGRDGSHDAPTKLPHQGMMVVVIWNIAATEADPLANNFISTKFYPTPSKDGAARIIDAQVQGDQMYLTVSTEGGSRFVFHVNDGTFRSLAP